MVFATHQYESAIGIHVSPPSWTPLPPPSPAYRSRLSQSTSFRCPALCNKLGLSINFTYGNEYVSMLFSQIGLGLINFVFWDTISSEFCFSSLQLPYWIFSLVVITFRCLSRVLEKNVCFLYFHTNCEITCSSSVKNTVGSLIGIALNL